MSNVFVRNPFNYDADAVSRETGLLCEDDTLTKQSFAEECDINTIVERFLHTGQLPENVQVPQYADFEETFDYQTAMNVITDARLAFAQMPAHVRSRFSNDPAQFVDFFNNPANAEEAVKLGLAVKKPLDNSTSSGNIQPAPPGASNGDNNANT